jgi:signal peptide peptidase SppA
MGPPLRKRGQPVHQDRGRCEETQAPRRRVFIFKPLNRYQEKSNNMNIGSQFWAGTEQSLALCADAEKLDMAPHAKAMADMGGPERGTPRLFSQSGGVGIISIAGPLVNTDSWMNAFMGRTSYGEIRDALMHAAADPSVGAILLDINSGGGAVSGVSDTAALIKKVDKEIKPVHTFSDGMIASAALWVGANARTLSVGQVTEAGSIGIITVHKEMSKALEMEGVKATVIKAGEHKGTGNMYAPLTPAAKAEIQGQLDHMYGIFMTDMAANRDMTYPIADAKFGQGRVFIGQQAVDAGLANSVTTFDATVSKLQGEIDRNKAASQYGANFSKGTNMRAALTEQTIAAMAEAGNLQVGTAAGVAAVAADLATKPAPAVIEPTAPEATAPVAESDIVAFLKTSLAEANATLMTATMELRDLKAAQESMTASHEALKGIATASVDRLRVALGHSAGAVALTDSALLADHASLRAQFESKFKAGGVAAVSSQESPGTKGELDDPVRQARLASTRFAK